MAHKHCNHSHGDGNIGLAFFLNFSFTIIEFIGGMLTNSIAIISDAVHDLGDSLSLAVAWYFQKKSKKPSTKQYTYGYKRFSLLGAIVTSVVLIVGSVYVLSEAIPRLVSPQETNAEGMFLLAIAGIVANGIGFFRTRKAGSINERVVSLHLLEDVLGWIAVLIGSAVMYFTGLTIIDPILSILIAGYVLLNVIKNIKLVMPILLQGTPPDVDYEYIIEKLKDNEYIDDLHDLHIWSLDDEYNVFTAHAVLKEAVPAEVITELKKAIRAVLKEGNIHHTTIEFELHDEACELIECTSPYTSPI